jgi:quinol monooxygenase YgiN
MYIRVMRGHFSPANTDETVRIARDQLVPALKQRPGFRNYYAGLNHDAGTIIAISTWDTREQAQEAQTARGPFQSLGIQFEAPEIFEVTVEA